MRIKKILLFILFIAITIFILVLFLFYKYINSEQIIPFQDVEKVSVSSDMTFGVIIDSASYRYPGHDYGAINLEDSKKEIDAIKELGVDFARFDIRNETLDFQEEVDKLDQIIAYARSKELKIYLGIYGVESWMNFKMWYGGYPYGGAGKADWEDFKDMYIYQANILAQKYKPDYMMIMCEAPFNIGNQVNSVRTIDEWVEFTKEVAQNIKNISPTTKIVLNEIIQKGGGPHEDSEYEFSEAIIFDNSELIDIISTDPYSLDDLNEQVSNLVDLKEKYNWHGNVWIGETNLLAFDRLFRLSTPEEDENQKNYFIYAIDLAEKNNFDGFVIFYLRDGTNDVGMGIMYNDFTSKPAYNAIKEILSKSG